MVYKNEALENEEKFDAISLVKKVPMIEAVYMAAEAWKSVKESTICNVFKKVWGTEACKEKLVDFDALDEVPCPPQMERETFLSQVDLEAPFQADLEMEADEFESNNNQNEPNENDPEPEKVHSIAETLLSLSNIRAHLMSLGEDTEAFDSLKKLESIFIKKTIEESQSKQADITKFFPVNQLTLR